MESLQVIFGRRVRSAREERGWSQEELGRAAGLGGKYVGVIERGVRAATFDAVEKIAKALAVDSYLLFVPASRRSDLVARHIKSLLADPGRIDVAHVQEFLAALAASLNKLDRRSAGLK